MAFQSYDATAPHRNFSHSSSGSSLVRTPHPGGRGSLEPRASVQRTASSASSHYEPPNPNARPPRSQSASRRPPPPCPPGVDPTHYRWFMTVDVDRSGQISPKELQQALINGDQSKFESETIKLLFGMFDVDRSGTIGIDEYDVVSTTFAHELTLA